MPDIQDWLRSHSPQWKHRQPRTEENFIPRPIFGEEDADTEWQHNLNPQQIFAPIASYDEFSSYGSLFLFGRRGTGKTALLHMLTHDVNTNGPAAKQYCCAILLQPVVAELLPIFRGAMLADLKDSDLISLMRLVWRWVIISAAYAEIAVRYPQARAQGCDLAAKLHRALDDGLRDGQFTNFLLEELLAIFKAAFKDVTPNDANQLALTTILLREKLGGSSTRQLETQIRTVYQQQKRPTLVLIETEEVYRIDDRFETSSRSSLIDEILDIYKYFRQGGFLAKAAFPSEIYPFLEPANIEKIENKIVFILWRYRDLVTFVAKRYYRLLNENRRVGKLEKELHALEDFGHAKRFLNTVFPAQLATRNNIKLDTLSYIIRHTQKKPRQLIAIFNCILTMVADAGLKPDNLLHEEATIRDAVHSRLDTLVGGCLDIYSHIYPGAVEIVRKSMTGMPCYFSAADLDKSIKQTKELRGQELRREDVRQLLVQSGVIGLTLAVPSPLPKSDPAASMMEAIFEYQVKGRLIVTGNSVCVVHPMFYEELQIQIDVAVLAYPKPSEEEEELLRHSGLLH